MKKFATLVSLIAIAALAAACGAVSNGGTASPTPSGSSTPTPTGTQAATTIKAIQTGSVPVNTSVTLTAVVVTAVDSFGDFYAQDVGGGANSGAFFFDKNHKAPAGLAIGDELTITGTYTEYAGPVASPWTGAHTETEIVPDSVTQTNTGLTPTIDTIDAASLSSLNDTNGEQWEGCLVKITGAPAISSVGMGFGEFAIKGSGTDTLRIDHALYNAFEPAVVGQTLPTLVGVIADDFKHYHLEPRMSSDIAFSGTNTVQSFATINALIAAAAGTSPTLVPGRLVKITGTISVTAHASYTNTNSNKTMNPFWAQDGLTAATKSAIYFEDPFYSNPAAIPGNQMTGVTGKYIEYGSTFKTHSIQIGFSDTGTVAGSGSVTLSPLSVSVGAVRKAATNVGDYESVFVKLSETAPALTVLVAPNSFNEYTVGTDATTNFVTIGTLAVDTHAPGGTPVAATRGVTLAQGVIYFAHALNYLIPTAPTDIAFQ